MRYYRLAWREGSKRFMSVVCRLNKMYKFSLQTVLVYDTILSTIKPNVKGMFFWFDGGIFLQVSRLQEQLQAERDLRAALEVGLSMSSGQFSSHGVDSKVSIDFRGILSFFRTMSSCESINDPCNI